MTRLHPESYRQLRQLAKLHGTLLLEQALREITEDLVSEYEAETHRRMSESTIIPKPPNSPSGV